MSKSEVFYYVHWTNQINKKHKSWNSGELRWHSSNSIAYLYDEDGKKLCHSFIIGGVIMEKEYNFEGHLIIPKALKDEYETAQNTIPISCVPIKRKFFAPRISNKKRVPIYSKDDLVSNDDSYSKQANSNDNNNNPCQTYTTEVNHNNQIYDNDNDESYGITKENLNGEKNSRSNDIYSSSSRLNANFIQPSARPPKIIPKDNSENTCTLDRSSEASSESTKHDTLPTFIIPKLDIANSKTILKNTLENDQEKSSELYMQGEGDFLNKNEVEIYKDSPRIHYPLLDWNSFLKEEDKENSIEDRLFLDKQSSTYNNNNNNNNNNNANSIPLYSNDKSGNIKRHSPFFVAQHLNSEPGNSDKKLNLKDSTSKKINLNLSNKNQESHKYNSNIHLNNKNFVGGNEFISDLNKSNLSNGKIQSTGNSNGASDSNSSSNGVFSNKITGNFKSLKGNSESILNESKILDFHDPKTSHADPKRSIFNTNSRSDFCAPAMLNPYGHLLEWDHNQIIFPSYETCSKLIFGKSACRTIDIPACFSSLESYKSFFSKSIIEEINHIMLEMACIAHKTISSFSSNTEDTSHSTLEKMRSYMRTRNKKFYFNCELVIFNKRIRSKNSGSVVEERKILLRLPEESRNMEHYSAFSKDDIWILSSSPYFNPKSISDIFFICKSIFHGRPQGAMEMKGISLDEKRPLKWDGDILVHAIHGPNLSSEFCIMEYLNSLSFEKVPLLPILLNGNWINKSENNSIKESDKSNVNNHNNSIENKLIKSKLNNQIVDNFSSLIDCGLNSSRIESIFKEYIVRYNLNEDQALVIKRACSWFNTEKAKQFSPITLVHGVFGSGKSHLLVILIKFLSELMDYSEECDHLQIFVSSATNTAVDRILKGLLDIGYDSFLRVGSLRRIDKSILPYSIHREKSGNQKYDHNDYSALKDLDEMLRERDLNDKERALILEEKKAIQSGLIERRIERINEVRVIGATCIASAFPILDGKEFHIVILDECSQIIEPLSLIPVARFSTKILVLVGDPMQLPPQLKSRSQKPLHGLGKPLFSRLTELNHEPILLRKQYRLHPILSKLASDIFYDGKLLDGIRTDDRNPLVLGVPTILFIDVSNGSELFDNSKSIKNFHEATVVSELVRILLDKGIKNTQIGIICLYKAQVRLIEDILVELLSKRDDKREDESPSKEKDASISKSNTTDFTISSPPKDTRNRDETSDYCYDKEYTNLNYIDEAEKEESKLRKMDFIKVSTVDSFQGAEKDLIILSCCRTEYIGFADSPYRINVALTRGRYHLIIIGNTEALSTSPLWLRILNQIRRVPNSIRAAIEILSEGFNS